MVFIRRSGLLMLAVVAVCSVACEEGAPVRETYERGVRTAKRHVVSTVDELKEKAQVAGEMDLALDSPVKTSGCYASLIVVDAQRPSVLQITSYKDAENEKFPSVFLRALVEPTSAADLAGQTVPAQMFVQHQRNGPVWHSLAPEHVPLRIDKTADYSITATILDGQLVSTETGETMDVSGTFSGSLK